MVLQNFDMVKQFGMTTEDLTVDFFLPNAAKEFVDDDFQKAFDKIRPIP